ncbi:unnamed protein product [Penicillium salamii]|uniref:Uncharacterized protein n=1 Tax=Penicillium salamii TaxID=1612424 RepID=A0A9W4NGR7_9EURO|nr:unnamed protein product [Penicillium salamii]CAG8040244.1 unnamed protein product [Penicillium salamii]CAG8051686.1 unnamed protein product [Penicillium salamii]CAG8206438.1 unnamed protein product [Penicillium salamii]CAG8322206.1 unnamed protein product [Penicillium salamii]
MSKQSAALSFCSSTSFYTSRASRLRTHPICVYIELASPSKVPIALHRSTLPLPLPLIPKQPIYHNTTMASLWYCCCCSFGPHNLSLHEACIQCGTPRCGRCTEQKVSDSMNLHSHSHSYDITSAYPAAVPTNSPPTPTFKPTTMDIAVPDLPRIRALPRADCTSISSTPLGGVRTHGETYMYICCSCHDGPKIYNHQPQCVECGHMSCGRCVYVK